MHSTQHGTHNTQQRKIVACFWIKKRPFRKAALIKAGLAFVFGIAQVGTKFLRQKKLGGVFFRKEKKIISFSSSSIHLDVFQISHK